MKPLVLMILDGWGCAPAGGSSAIAAAHKPYYDYLSKAFPTTTLKASGLAVGLPEGQMGNSEVGHLNIGAGRVVYQELTRISKAVRDGDFAANPVLNEAIDGVKQRGAALHLFGLLSDGGVHSHLDHLYALLSLAKNRGLERVYVHAFLDGRDVPPTSAGNYLAELNAKMQEIGIGQLATLQGRYYAMDRDKRWERIERAYRCLVFGEGRKAADAETAIKLASANGETDEFVLPTVIEQNGVPVATVAENDAVIFYNFRPDRARQITRSFVDVEFPHFARPFVLRYGQFICMTQYDATINAPIAFPPQQITNTLGEVLSAAGINQLRIAETEKYAHVTFFFNGGVENPNPGETRILIPSPKVATYDLKPEMSAGELTETVVKEIQSGKHDVIIMNYANPDMLGHTGNMAATVKAVETIDECLAQVVTTTLACGGALLITADHGNAEMMVNPKTGNPHTAHTENDVPLILVGVSRNTELRYGALADIAPTMLRLLGIAKPAEMTGETLIVR